MDDGSKSGSGLKLSVNSFNYSDCMLLVNILYNNFQLKATIQSSGAVGIKNLSDQYIIYI
jgi:hypothetical protein